MLKNSVYFLLILFLSPENLKAQFLNYPLNPRSELVLKKVVFDSVNRQLPGFKPYLIDRLDLCEVEGFKKDTAKYYYWYTEKLFSENLIKLETPDFDFYLDPNIELYLGKDFSDNSLYSDTTTFMRNTRGIMIRGRVGERITFETSFRENQALFPFYLFTYARNSDVVPGQGRTKSFDRTGFDFASSSALVSFRTGEWINLQFGHGKHFIGQGYRSLLLSDHSFNYPFLRITLDKGNLVQYNSIIALLQNLERIPSTLSSESFFKRKQANFNYLEFNIINRAKIGFFEGVLWERFDNQQGTIQPEWQSFVPIIFFNTITQGLEGDANIVVGTNASVRIYRFLQAYGQLVIDDKNENHLGWQAGVEAYTNNKLSLFGRAEFNTLDPFIFRAEGSQPSIHYSHYNEPLSHPLGAGFSEMIGQLGACYRKWQLRLQYQFAQFKELDSDTGSADPGSNIFLPKPTTETNVSGYNRNLNSFNLTLSYFLNPKNNLEIFFEMNKRELESKILDTESSLVFNFGIRTLWTNRYYDF